MNKRQFCRGICFLLLCVLMLSGLNWLLRDRETTLSSLYSEADESVDVLIVGSSHVNSGYMPNLLWQEYGISASNAYSWSQPMWVSYHYMIESLKHQSPSVVVLDLNGMLYGNSSEQPEETDRVSYTTSFNLDASMNFLRLIHTVSDCGIDLRDPVDFLPLIRYHSRWKDIDESFFTYDPHEQYDFMHGFGFQVNVFPQSRPEYPRTEERTVPYETAIAYLDRIVKLSEKENFSLVFVLAPYAFQANEPAIFNWLQDYAQDHEIPFLNYCAEDGTRIGLDWQTDFCDARHVNYIGAQKLTRDLGEFLSSRDDPLRTAEQLPNAKQLDTDAAKMNRVIAIHENLQQGEQHFLQWACENGVLAVSAGGVKPTGELAALNALEQGGLAQIYKATLPDMSYAAICTQGKAEEMLSAEGEPCRLQQGLLQAESTGRQTVGASLGYKDFSYSGNCLEMLYYDPILEYPVYHISMAEDGTLQFRELSVADRLE